MTGISRQSSSSEPAAPEATGAGSSFFRSLIRSLLAISEPRDPDEALERTRVEAQTLFRASGARIVPPGETPAADPRASEDAIRLPLREDAEIGTLELSRDEPFTPAERSHAELFASFAAQAVQKARVLAEAHAREEERARLTERLITAEQDERRRLSVFLHDGPLQAMSGIALMHDAALAAIREGRYDAAASIVENALDRERATIRTLRDLSFAIEPVVLRDEGFSAAVRALGEQVERSDGISVSVDVAVGERLAEKAQVALYQLIREALYQAARRRPSRIAVAISERDGAFTVEVRDDGMEERRRRVVEELGERVRVLNGNVALDAIRDGGTAVRVVLPAYAGARRPEGESAPAADEGAEPG